jgi:hypothetical protein
MRLARLPPGIISFPRSSHLLKIIQIPINEIIGCSQEVAASDHSSPWPSERRGSLAALLY